MNSWIIPISFPALLSDSLAKKRKNDDSGGTAERRIDVMRNKRARIDWLSLKKGKNRTNNPRRI